ncbi:SRPBCC domain-containing protein [Roseivirga misakiensis]|uniref:Activator of HSP90 ATPase n=1 Tax=Roseivirga misakiensis TaxID=1563681 RepID=A0A1E5T0P9_9BACT|nr:SRPBCC domain-containing protein [Roseivirga misakiensis]OEK04958.1 activator of HSP90 ATPase [Roseivirga misakiensis]
MSEANDRTLSLERTFDAPIQLVWEAWTKPEHIAQWWGPKGMETRIIAHKFAIGGAWKYAMTMPDGSEFIADGVYKDIVELKHIISSANFRPMTEGVEIQAYFEAAGDKTNFRFSVVHPTAEYCQQQEQMGFMNGWGSVFDRLSEFVGK